MFLFVCAYYDWYGSWQIGLVNSYLIISGVTGGGGGQGEECPPETSDWEILADVSGKKRQGKKEKGGN